MDALDKSALLAALAGHIGSERGIHANALALEVCADDGAAAQRRLRAAIENLRRAGTHICGTPESGYFIAATEGELDRTCEFLYQRAMTSLVQVAAMKNVSLPDLRGQLRLPLNTGPSRPSAALDDGSSSRSSNA